MKKVFIIIICAAAALILGYGIKHAVTPVSSQDVERAAYEHSVSADGYIIREEEAYYADRPGKLYKNVSVGSRVAKDSLIYTIYNESVSDAAIKELNTIDRKIAAAKEALYSDSYDSVSISVESEIASRTAQIIAAARGNDVGKISKYKQDINSLRQNGAVDTSYDELSALENQKAELEARIGGEKSERYAENSGVFTMYYDGFEEILSADKAEEYTVGYLESLNTGEVQDNNSDTVETGDFICSVVNNHIWSVILVADTESISGCKAGDSLTLRFNNIAGEEKKGTIRYISSGEQNSGGKSFIIVECPDYFEGAFSYRAVDVDIIFESFSGYKVPSQAIRTEGNEYKVIGLIDNKQYECGVDILYSDTKEGYVIVDSTEDAQYKISNMDRILVGER